MIMSEDITKLSAALVRAQEDVGIAIKTSTNPHYNSSYADLTSVLGVIKPALAAHGLALVQYPGYEDGIVTMVSVLLHDSGQWIESPVAAIPISKRDPHGAASGISYLRRYCASSLMALIADDDDGNAAVGPTKRFDEGEFALQQKLDTLTGLLLAAEEGTVDHKTVKLCRDIIQNGGPADRADAAIRHLTMEIGRD
jgi:hypothetical protein